MSSKKIDCPYCHGWIEIEGNEIKNYDKEVVDSPKRESTPQTKSNDEGSPYKKVVKPAIEWDESCTLGIKDIDDQHHKIANLINTINESVRADVRDQNLINDILKELSSYVKEHFTLEEQLFMNSDYPHKKAHRKKHKLFTKQVVDLYHLSKESYVDLKPILGFLVGWFLEHSLGTDREYTKYIDCNSFK